MFKSNLFMFSLISAVICHDAQSSEQQDSQYREREILRHVIEHGIECSQESDTEIRQALERLSKEINLSEKQKAFLQFYLAKMRHQGIGKSLNGKKFSQSKGESQKDTSFIKAANGFRSLINDLYLPKDLKAQACFYIAEMNFNAQTASSDKNYGKVIEALESLNLLAGHNPNLLSQSMYDQAMFMLVNSYQHSARSDDRSIIIRKVYEEYERKNGMSCWTKEQQIEAKFSLANMYYKGQGGEKRKDLSTPLYEQLLELWPANYSYFFYPIHEVKTKVAYAYYYGRGVNQDRSKAQKILQEIMGQQHGWKIGQEIKYFFGKAYFENGNYGASREVFEELYFRGMKIGVSCALNSLIKDELSFCKEYGWLENASYTLWNREMKLRDEVETGLQNNERKQLELGILKSYQRKIRQRRNDLLNKLQEKEPLRSLYGLHNAINNSGTFLEVLHNLILAEHYNVHPNIAKINIFEGTQGDAVFSKDNMTKTKRIDMFVKLATIYQQYPRNIEEYRAAQFIFNRLSKIKTLKPKIRSAVDSFITGAQGLGESSSSAKKRKYIVGSENHLAITSPVKRIRSGDVEES